MTDTTTVTEKKTEMFSRAEVLEILRFAQRHCVIGISKDSWFMGDLPCTSHELLGEYENNKNKKR